MGTIFVMLANLMTQLPSGGLKTDLWSGFQIFEQNLVRISDGLNTGPGSLLTQFEYQTAIT